MSSATQGTATSNEGSQSADNSDSCLAKGLLKKHSKSQKNVLKLF